MTTSFLSEHSVEFCLIHRAIQVLSPRWKVTPLFFWRSREGSRIAQKCDDEQIKVLAVYARRPKISSPGNNMVEMKINGHIFSRANYLSIRGIPVLCAVPRVSSILDFRVDSLCSWFSLSPVTNCIDMELRVDINTGDIQGDSASTAIVPIEERQICEIVEEKAQEITLSEVISILKSRDGENINDHSRFFGFGAKYKPVYLFLQEGND